MTSKLTTALIVSAPAINFSLSGHVQALAPAAEVRWPRIYRVLRAAGHDPANAAEILLDARRKDNHARPWIKAVLAYERRDRN
jgi:hypothetical protein